MSLPSRSGVFNRESLDRGAVGERYQRVRARTESLAAPLSAEDMLVQSMPDASPTKWHLGHTTWFFEEFVLARFAGAHKWHDERWRVLFNSYYDSVGPQFARPMRGLLSRPPMGEILGWRARVDAQMMDLMARADEDVLATTLLGTHHEQQHQELVLTDIKHALSVNPMCPSYLKDCAPARLASGESLLDWLEYPETLSPIGHEGDGFAFDNEGPRHRALVGPFLIASRLVTNAEYARFVRDRGYRRPELWLSEGWACMREGGWRAPLYWETDGHEWRNEWRAFTMRGMDVLDMHAPVTHLSFYEADAYARWCGARLPTEEEWEVAASGLPVEGNFVESGLLAPASAQSIAGRAAQLYGDAWEWTASAYLPYPRFRPLEGSLGEYNGKFMSGQMVLRGGSCFSPRDHVRATYRNFFPPRTRWQVSGVRLAKDV